MSAKTLKLEGVLNIARVEKLHSEFEELEKNSAPLVIDVKDVTRVDTSVLQLFVALFKSMSGLGVEVSWAGASDEFKAAAELLGVTNVLGLD
tara:strand:+ start:55122 stop:55397 length:276 start_codon:yes stop_codon:yes gene_type:complete